MQKYYAGIGSRLTPSAVCDKFTMLSYSLEAKGFILRSGGAYGADQAFEKGVCDSSKKNIYLPTNATSEAIEMASKFHPAWYKCSTYAKELHGRNAMIILGENLNEPVRFVVCWTKSGKPQGGTAMGISIAEAYNIPVFNVKNIGEWDKLTSVISNLPKGSSTPLLT